jgi:hypothetical protein
MYSAESQCFADTNGGLEPQCKDTYTIGEARIYLTDCRERFGDLERRLPGWMRKQMDGLVQYIDRQLDAHMPSEITIPGGTILGRTIDGQTIKIDARSFTLNGNILNPMTGDTLSLMLRNPTTGKSERVTFTIDQVINLPGVEITALEGRSIDIPTMTVDPMTVETQAARDTANAIGGAAQERMNEPGMRDAMTQTEKRINENSDQIQRVRTALEKELDTSRMSAEAQQAFDMFLNDRTTFPNFENIAGLDLRTMFGQGWGNAFDGRIRLQCNPCRAVRSLFKLKREIATRADQTLSLNFCKTKEFQNMLKGNADQLFSTIDEMRAIGGDLKEAAKETYAAGDAMNQEITDRLTEQDNKHLDGEGKKAADSAIAEGHKEAGTTEVAGEITARASDTKTNQEYVDRFEKEEKALGEAYDRNKDLIKSAVDFAVKNDFAGQFDRACNLVTQMNWANNIKRQISVFLTRYKKQFNTNVKRVIGQEANVAAGVRGSGLWGYLTREIIQPMQSEIMDASDCGFIYPAYRQFMDGFCYVGAFNGIGVAQSMMLVCILLFIMTMAMLAIWRVIRDNQDTEAAVEKEIRDSQRMLENQMMSQDQDIDMMNQQLYGEQTAAAIRASREQQAAYNSNELEDSKEYKGGDSLVPGVYNEDDELTPEEKASVRASMAAQMRAQEETRVYQRPSEEVMQQQLENEPSRPLRPSEAILGRPSGNEQLSPALTGSFVQPQEQIQEQDSYEMVPMGRGSGGSSSSMDNRGALAKKKKKRHSDRSNGSRGSRGMSKGQSPRQPASRGHSPGSSKGNSRGRVPRAAVGSPGKVGTERQSRSPPGMNRGRKSRSNSTRGRKSRGHSRSRSHGGRR